MELNVLLDELRKLKLPRKQFAVTTSGTLAVRGIREAHDIDVIVTKKLWQELVKKWPVVLDRGLEKIDIGNIEILGTGSCMTGKDFRKSERMIRDADIFNGIRFVKLEAVENGKKLRNKRKDIRDVKLIKKYLDSQ